jgi:hypothetical protein
MAPKKDKAGSVKAKTTSSKTPATEEPSTSSETSTMPIEVLQKLELQKTRVICGPDMNYHVSIYTIQSYWFHSLP